MSLLTTVNGRGTLAARSAAAAANEGYIYSATDASLYRSNGTSWDTIGGPGIADMGTATYLDFTTAAAPAAPAAGKIRVYSKTGDTFAQKTSGGTETVFGAGGGGGALVLLASLTASASASLDFTTFISATYDDYVFRLVNVVPATNAVDFYMQVSAAAVFDTGANYYNNNYLQASSGNVSAVGSADNAIAARRAAEISNGSTVGLCGDIDLFNPQSTTSIKRVGGHIRWAGTSGNFINTILDGHWKTTGSAIDGVRFLFSGGSNIASGTIRVYGVAKA